MTRVKSTLGFILWTVVPIAVAAIGTILGLVGQAVPERDATGVRLAAAGAAALLALLLIGKAVHDRRWKESLVQARYDAVVELHNRLAPALDLMTELALVEGSDVMSRELMLRNIASDCCGALHAMTPTSTDVRATVFRLSPPDEIAPLARFGRQDAARTFRLSTREGREVMDFLETATSGELFTDTVKRPPPRYTGDTDRYRTFIRVPIRGSGIVFGMLTVDAPKKGSLSEGDVRLAELVAAELGAAFAIAAS